MTQAKTWNKQKECQYNVHHKGGEAIVAVIVVVLDVEMVVAVVVVVYVKEKNYSKHKLGFEVSTQTLTSMIFL